MVQVDKPYKGSGKKWEMPTKDDNYHRTLQDKPWRNTLKPLNIDQPEGPSFQVLCTSRNQRFFSNAMRTRPQPVQTLMHVGTSVCILYCWKEGCSHTDAQNLVAGCSKRSSRRWMGTW